MSPVKERLMGIDEIQFFCPFCGESNTTDADPANVGHEYVEDCQVCCRPILVTLKRQLSFDLDPDDQSERDLAGIVCEVRRENY